MIPSRLIHWSVFVLISELIKRSHAKVFWLISSGNIIQASIRSSDTWLAVISIVKPWVIFMNWLGDRQWTSSFEQGVPETKPANSMTNFDPQLSEIFKKSENFSSRFSRKRLVAILSCAWNARFFYPAKLIWISASNAWKWMMSSSWGLSLWNRRLNRNLYEDTKTRQMSKI